MVLVSALILVDGTITITIIVAILYIALHLLGVLVSFRASWSVTTVS
jgi:hypothetical protein